ncbi:flagellar hook-length control protein FliK [Parvibium lacunae]|uniref:Flagellar hook-length control protein FliK n=1 Tax=Parvibium lacunae TaxID=1888893 RepID=A0A368L409_9BURK|nr:flagellar hook-length control protein FliK [Parvibium lacunae]RCS58321.1 flagellar hook-length control protein FliK [Parvibium lacunae]
MAASLLDKVSSPANLMGNSKGASPSTDSPTSESFSQVFQQTQQPAPSQQSDAPARDVSGPSTAQLKGEARDLNPNKRGAQQNTNASTSPSEERGQAPTQEQLMGMAPIGKSAQLEKVAIDLNQLLGLAEETPRQTDTGESVNNEAFTSALAPGGAATALMAALSPQTVSPTSLTVSTDKAATDTLTAERGNLRPTVSTTLDFAKVKTDPAANLTLTPESGLAFRLEPQGKTETLTNLGALSELGNSGKPVIESAAPSNNGTASTVNPAALNPALAAQANAPQQGSTPQLAHYSISHPVYSPQFANEAAQTLHVAINTKIQQAEIAVNPPDMGPIRIQIQVNGNDVNLTIAVQQVEARQAIEDSLPKLRELLGQNGMDLGQTALQQQTAGQYRQDNQQPQSGNGWRNATAEDSAIAPVAGTLLTQRSSNRMLDLFA